MLYSATSMVVGGKRVVTRRGLRSQTITVMMVGEDEYIDGDVYIYRWIRGQWHVSTRAVFAAGFISKSWRYSVFSRPLDVIKYTSGKVSGVLSLMPDGSVMSIIAGLVDGKVGPSTKICARRGDFLVEAPTAFYDAPISVFQHRDTKPIMERQEILRAIQINNDGLPINYIKLYPRVKK